MVHQHNQKTSTQNTGCLLCASQVERIIANTNIRAKYKVVFFVPQEPITRTNTKHDPYKRTKDKKQRQRQRQNIKDKSQKTKDKKTRKKGKRKKTKSKDKRLKTTKTKDKKERQRQ